MVRCLLIDSTHSVLGSMTTLFDKNSSFKLSVVLNDVQLIQSFTLPDRDLSEKPVFYVATPNATADLTLLSSIGANLTVVLSGNLADAAVAYDHDALDFMALPLNEQRLRFCLGKLTRAIQRTNNGYVDVLLRLTTLTKTQRVVLRKIGEQRTTRQIADELFVSTKTVDTHRANIRELLQFDNRRPLAPFAVSALQQNLL
mgnify:CR=1 FL=1